MLISPMPSIPRYNHVSGNGVQRGNSGLYSPTNKEAKDVAFVCMLETGLSSECREALLHFNSALPTCYIQRSLLWNIDLCIDFFTWM